MSDAVQAWRDRDEAERLRRRDVLAAAVAEFPDLARVACTGDMTLLSPGPAHWVLKRSRGKTVILQFWPSAEKLQMSNERRSRPCTLAQLRAIMHDQLGCPPVLTEREK